MKRLFFLLMLLYAASNVCHAQDDISGKLSMTTQMFLNDKIHKSALSRRALSNDRNIAIYDNANAHILYDENNDQMYAEPEVYDDVTYISAFIRVEDDALIYELEEKGVRVDSKFKNGLITANIPVDSIESIAKLDNVKRVNVARDIHLTSKSARSATKVNDVLTRSENAIATGLPSEYDGRGVIIGVIDRGFDFQHIAFKDRYGNSRIKRAYVYENGMLKTYTDIKKLTTDNPNEDHGTHTASTAGGSSVIIKSDKIVVTDDHANATYGGIAPCADLCLVGFGEKLNTKKAADAIKMICDYADSVGKPLVLSNSWGNPRWECYNYLINGKSNEEDLEEIIEQYFGDNHPNHICLFAAGNHAGKECEGGGPHIQGTATKDTPLGTVVRCYHGYNADGGYRYDGIIIADAWTNSLITGKLACKIFVLRNSNGEILKEVIADPEFNESKYITLGGYYGRNEGTICVTAMRYERLNRCRITLSVIECDEYGNNKFDTESYDAIGTGNNEFRKSNYTLAVQFYPTEGECFLDVLGGEHKKELIYSYFVDTPTTKDCIWTNGSDNSSVSAEATIPNVIAIGSYVSKNCVVDYNGNNCIVAENNAVGDIAHYSSYQEYGCGLTGQMLPWITAPGVAIIAGVNSYHKKNGYLDDYYNKFDKYRVNRDVENPYGCMSGTSAATPVAAGVVALWLQAAKKENISLTTTDVKNIMRNTAIHDSYTNGANASHFGNGKINALAGLGTIVGKTRVDFADKYILRFEMDSNENLNVKIMDGRANCLANCNKMQVIIINIADPDYSYQETFSTCEANISLNPYFYPKGIYSIAVLLYDKTNSTPTVVSSKFYKRTGVN